MLKHFTSLNQEKPIEQYFSLGFKLTVFSAITWVCCQCWKRRLLKNPWVLPTRGLAYNAFGNVNRLHSTPILKLRFQIKYPNVSSPIQSEIDFPLAFDQSQKDDFISDRVSPHYIGYIRHLRKFMLITTQATAPHPKTFIFAVFWTINLWTKARKTTEK